MMVTAYNFIWDYGVVKMGIVQINCKGDLESWQSKKKKQDRESIKWEVGKGLVEPAQWQNQK